MKKIKLPEHAALCPDCGELMKYKKTHYVCPNDGSLWIITYKAEFHRIAET